jgi:hypothetical protein
MLIILNEIKIILINLECVKTFRVINIFLWIFIVNQTLKSQASFTVNPIVCTDQTITLTASTGTFPATSFNWSVFPAGAVLSAPNASVTNLTFSATGMYTIVLMASTSSSVSYAVQNVTVNLSPNLTVSSSTDAICTGATATLTASGALSYSWSPAATLSSSTAANVVCNPAGSTTYVVTGSNNNGCAMTKTVSVEVYNIPPGIQVSATSISLCPGFTSTLSATGAQHYTWTSTSGATLYGSTVTLGICQYTVYGADNSKGYCAQMFMSSIIVAPPLNVTATKDKNVTCLNPDNPKYSLPVTLTATGASQYEWKPYVPGYMTYSLGASTIVSPTISTCYTVTGSTSICSGSAVICLSVVANCVGMKEEQQEDIFYIQTYDPVTENFKVQVTINEPTELSIINLSGQTIFKSETRKENIYHVPSSAFPAGIYVMQLTTPSGIVQRSKVIFK